MRMPLEQTFGHRWGPRRSESPKQFAPLFFSFGGILRPRREMGNGQAEGLEHGKPRWQSVVWVGLSQRLINGRAGAREWTSCISGNKRGVSVRSVSRPSRTRCLTEGSHQVLELISSLGSNGCSVNVGNLGYTQPCVWTLLQAPSCRR